MSYHIFLIKKEKNLIGKLLEIKNSQGICKNLALGEVSSVVRRVE